MGILSQIQSQVNCIIDLMSSTFEALLLKLESHDSTAPLQEPNPQMAKKAREFETRFQRQIFEGKQKALVLESAALKYKVGPSGDGRHRDAFQRSLYQCLKCCVSALTSYTHHLPFCDDNAKLLFPPALKTLVQQLQLAAAESRNVADTGIQRTDQLAKDCERLKTTIERFSNQQEGRVKMIEKLAMQKFGATSSVKNLPATTNGTRKKIRKKQKEIIPRSNAVLRQRSEHSRAKLASPASTNPPEESPRTERSLPKSNATSRPVHNEIKGSPSEKIDKLDSPIQVDDIDNHHAINSLKRMAFEQEEPSLDSRKGLNHFPSPRVEGRSESPTHRFETGLESAAAGGRCGGVKFLDIGSDELNELIMGRRRIGGVRPELTRAPPSGGGLENNPMLLVGQIAQTVVNDVVVKVCDELLSVDIINNLIDVELK